MKGSGVVLVGAVVIHDPEFLGAGVAVNESDLRSGDARNTAGEFGDDFVGELVSEFAHLCVGGIAAIDLAHDGFGGGTANIEHPSEDGNFGGSFGEIPEGQEIRVDGILGPVEHAEFPGLGRSVGRIEAGLARSTMPEKERSSRTTLVKRPAWDLAESGREAKSDTAMRS